MWHGACDGFDLTDSTKRTTQQGNFLITNDGRLCILDHGLITEIKEEQRIALVQYVAHLLAKGTLSPSDQPVSQT